MGTQKDTIVESMRLLAQFGNHLEGLFGLPSQQKEPLVTITMSEYERLKSGIPSIEDVHEATMCNLAIIRENHSHDAEMIRLQEENEKLRQELEKLKNRKKWRIFRWKTK